MIPLLALLLTASPNNCDLPSGQCSSVGFRGTLSASPALKALCPLSVQDSSGTWQMQTDCAAETSALYLCATTENSQIANDGCGLGNKYPDGGWIPEIYMAGNGVFPTYNGTAFLTTSAFPDAGDAPWKFFNSGSRFTSANQFICLESGGAAPSSCQLRIMGDGSLLANQGSGSTAFGVLVNGARIDFGAGTSDYASSDGTTVTFAGPIATANKLTFSATGTGVVPLFENSNTASIGGANQSAMILTPSTGTNVSMSLNLMPLGTGIANLRTGIAVYSTNYLADSVNYGYGVFTAKDATTVQFATVGAGTVATPDIVWAPGGGATSMRDFASGRIAINSDTDDGANQLQVNGATKITGALAATTTFSSGGGTFTTATTGKITLDSTDSTGTPGNATINKPSGRSAIASAASTLVITNSTVTTSSIVLLVIQTVDATCTGIKAVVPASGSFTLTVNAACAGNTNVGWVVVN